jgi:hypothetical protein
MGPDRVQFKTKGFEEATLLCNSNTSTTTTQIIDVLGVREGGGQAFPHSPRSNFTISNRTRNFVASASRLLAVINMGAHYHNVTHYVEDLDLLLDVFQRRDDIVYFRTTPSGHVGCQPKQPRTFNFTAGIRDIPLSSYGEFVGTSRFEWNLFDEYNTHTKKTVAQRGAAQFFPLSAVGHCQHDDSPVGWAWRRTRLSPLHVTWSYRLVESHALHGPEGGGGGARRTTTALQEIVNGVVS